MPYRKAVLQAGQYYHIYNRGHNRQDILNPVHAGLVSSPENWEFSSYREYVGIRQGTLPRPSIVLDQFQSRTEYQQFVASYTEEQKQTIAHLAVD